MTNQRKRISSRTASRRARAAVLSLLAAGAALTTVGAPGAAAMKSPHVDANGNVAVCEFTIHVDLVGHGLTVSEILAGASGDRKTTFESDSGSANCTGKINGHTIQGAGAARMVGAYQASPLCLTGVGTGSIEMTVPRLLTMFGQQYETIRGDFGLDLSGVDWRQLGTLVDESDTSSAFSALAQFSPDSGSLCTTRAGTLSGRLVLGGTLSERRQAMS